MTIDARGSQVERPWGLQAAGATPPARGVKPRHVGLTLVGVVIGLMAIVVIIGSLQGAPSRNTGDASASATGAPTAQRQATIADQVLADPDKLMTLQRMGREQLGAILKDPDSAKYQDVVAVSPPRSKGSVAFCGLVNAKSSLGGYTGYTRFISVPGVGAWLRNSRAVRFKEVWGDFCQDQYVISKVEFVN